MNTPAYSYTLLSERIAQCPAEPRDSSRLMVLHRSAGTLEHRHFRDLGEYLQEGDCLVCNDTRVVPARLEGQRLPTGGKVEVLLLREQGPKVWAALGRPGRQLRPGNFLEFGKGELRARVVGHQEDGQIILEFDGSEDDEGLLGRWGAVPFPPYLRHSPAHPERYQTVYARVPGAVAAPTAGLHFTKELLTKLESRGVRVLYVTLHIGPHTFRPLRTDDPEKHPVEAERCTLDSTTALRLNQARSQGKRIVAVGTSVVRTLETAWRDGGVRPFAGPTDLFIRPGHRFRAMDALITNFHQPRSTPLLLVSAFVGWERLQAAYAAALRLGYRFLSFGDAMLVC